MTKRPADSFLTMSLRDVDHQWYARGYRPDIANSRKSPNEDPKGEVAYQRAFAEAAKHKPPRVPNPDFYPNSPSARNYIKQRAEAMFSERKSSQPSTPASASSPPTQQDRNPSPRNEPQYTPHRPSVSVNINSNPTTRPPSLTGYQFSPTTSRPTADARPFLNGPPTPVEPPMHAPMGPDKMLR